MNGTQDYSKYDSMSDDELLNILQQKKLQKTILPRKTSPVLGALSGALRGFSGQAPEEMTKTSPIESLLLRESLMRSRPQKTKTFKTPEGVYEYDPETNEAKLIQSIVPDQTKEDLMQSQLDLNRAIFESIQGGGRGQGKGEQLTYREMETGQEVPQEEALANISKGKQYRISKKIATRQGIKEDVLVKPEDLSTEEKTYLITANRVGSTLDTIQNDILPKLESSGKLGVWQKFQAQKMPFATIGDQDIQDFKSALAQLKSDIPFLRGGKQLTATEARRVDILLDPFGKTKETMQKDIARFKKEFGFGENIMRGGLKALQGAETKKEDIDPLGIR